MTELDDEQELSPATAPRIPCCMTCRTPLADFIREADGLSRCPNTFNGESHGYFGGHLVNGEIHFDGHNQAAVRCVVGSKDV